VQARGLMSSGWSINHRSGGKGATRLALESANTNIALNELPAGGAAITVAGKLVGFPAQVRNATKDRILEELTTIVPRQLAGADLVAAGPAWDAPHWEDCWTPGYVFPPNFQTTGGVVPAQGSAIDLTKQPNGDQPSSPDEEDLPSSRLWVLDHLGANPEGLTLGQLVDIGEGEHGAPSRRTISNALSDLMGRRQVSKQGAIWVAVPAEAVDEPEDLEG
jgi:hypothetical protein